MDLDVVGRSSNGINCSSQKVSRLSKVREVSGLKIWPGDWRLSDLRQKRMGQS